jgi:SAM-dependent methyltransferase
MADVQTERSKYERMHHVPGYSPGPGASYVSTFLTLIKRGDTVVDFGCGSGDAARLLVDLGYDVTLVDITRAGLRHDLKFIAASLHELPAEVPKATWGFCCDTMEHLPEEWVFPALKGMRARVDNIFFSISGVPDGWGKKIGETLHLTVKPCDWWVKEINRHWSGVVRKNESECVFELIGRA